MSAIIRAGLRWAWQQVGKSDQERLAQMPIPESIEHSEHVYLEDGNPMHCLAVYAPRDAEGLLPLVVSIHGGGWMYGEAALNAPFCCFFAEEGYAAMDMSYRLLPETDLKGMVQDVFASLHWMEKNGAAHHCDKKRWLMTGDSAGGQLCGLIACIQNSPALQKQYGIEPLENAPAGIVINHGVCSIAHFGAFGGTLGKWVDREMHVMMFGKHFSKNPLWHSASFEDTCKGLRLPPVLVISSIGDKLHAQSKKLISTLRANGIAYRDFLWEKPEDERLGHVFNVSYPNWEESKATNGEILSFFAACLEAADGSLNG